MSLLDKLEELAKKATPGPWAGACCQKEILKGRWAIHAYGPRPYFIDDPWHWTDYDKFPQVDQVRKDADYISEANPQNILNLCQALRIAMETINALDEMADSPEHDGWVREIISEKKPEIQKLLETKPLEGDAK